MSGLEVGAEKCSIIPKWSVLEKSDNFWNKIHKPYLYKLLHVYCVLICSLLLPYILMLMFFAYFRFFFFSKFTFIPSTPFVSRPLKNCMLNKVLNIYPNSVAELNINSQEC